MIQRLSFNECGELIDDERKIVNAKPVGLPILFTPDKEGPVDIAERIYKLTTTANAFTASEVISLGTREFPNLQAFALQLYLIIS